MTPLQSDVVRFGLVGSLGFAIDAGSLAALVHAAGLNPLVARLFAMAIAVGCTWLLHRHWTFPAGRLRAPLPQSLLYGSTQILGLSLNYFVFSVLVLMGGVWRSFPVSAAAVGSLGAMVLSYLLSKRVAFAEPRASSDLNCVDQ